MNLESVSKFTRGDSFTPAYFDYLDDEFSRTEFDVSKQKETIGRLVPRLMAAQREYLLFLNTIENYLRTTILSTLIQDFQKIVGTRPGLVELIQAHRSFIFSSADQTCLTDRGSRILEMIYRCIESAISFGQECRDLESSLDLRDERLDEIIAEKYSKIRRTLFQTRQNLCFLLSTLQAYFKKGVEAKSRHF